jgi:NADPH-dependent 2,4-dienoyl-CoA reductase/sulfur reductase-like enzyme/rhodanese-related sulfurtransferase
MTAATDPNEGAGRRTSEVGRGDVDHEAARTVVIVGGVAGGMSVATRLRRLDEDADIVVIERSAHVSYANCGLPYYVGGVIDEEDDLVLQTPEQLLARFRLDVRTDTEVTGIDPVAHTVTVRSASEPAPTTLAYDKLVLSPGATSVHLPIPGYDRVRSLRTVEDAATLASDVTGHPRRAVVIGGGFVGLETAENLTHAGVGVTVVEAAPQILANLDPELAILIQWELECNGVAVETNVAVSEITETAVVLADGRSLPADLVVGALGVRPETRLAECAGLVLGAHGGIAVDDVHRTSDPDVYAVGDVVEKDDRIGGGTSLIALANIANRQGRRVADHIAGRAVRPSPSLGTAIVKVFGLTAAMTGWNERRLVQAGRAFRAIHSHPLSHASYYPGAEPMALKLLFDPDDGAILGAQAVGGDGVDKRIDVIATAMYGGVTAEQLADLELAYAPPFSSAKDPVNMLGYMAENVRSGDCDVVAPDDLDDLRDDGWTVLDVRSPGEYSGGAIPGSVNAPVDGMRESIDDWGAGPFVVCCEVGQRGHTATAFLHERGIEARNLDGGYRTWLAWQAARLAQPELLDRRSG